MLSISVPFLNLVGADTRIGWLIAPPAIVTRLSEIRQEMESGISIFLSIWQPNS